MALDRATEKLAGDIYLIPVMLDADALVPDELKHIHFVHAEDRDCFEKLDESGISWSSLERIRLTPKPN